MDRSLSKYVILVHFVFLQINHKIHNYAVFDIVKMLKGKLMLQYIDNVAKTDTSLHGKIKVTSKVAVSLS